jgi:hypothetical protein
MKKISGILTVSTFAVLSLASARADMPVIDFANVVKWVQQGEQMTESIAQQKSQLRAMTNIPADLVRQVEGLLDQGVENPLAEIKQNLQAILHGGTGTCAGSSVILQGAQYAAATGGDFMGQSLNQRANGTAGLQACTQQMIGATQARLQQMPGLLNQLQGAQDVTQATAIGARIQYEQAIIQAQHQQASLMMQSAMLDRYTKQDQMVQKQRADAQEELAKMQAGAPTGVMPQVATAPVSFASP